MRTTNKLRLDVDQLLVESFSTAMPEGLRGTVRMHDSVTGHEEPQTLDATCECPPQTGMTACGQATCAWTCGCPHTNATCGDTCWNTCADSCYVCGPQDPI